MDATTTTQQTTVTHDGFRSSPAIGQLAAALAKAQAEIKGAAKDSENPHFRSRYADLASVWDACRGPLSKNGISVLQPTSAEGAKVTVTTLVAHASGEWISCSLTVTAQKSDPQGVGACVTYLRRFGLAAMVGVAPDDDDDGEAASGRETQTYRRPSSPGAPVAPSQSTRRRDSVPEPSDGDPVEKFEAELARATTTAAVEALSKHLTKGDPLWALAKARYDELILAGKKGAA